MQNLTARLIVCSLAGSLALAACGGSSPHSVSAGDKKPAAAPAATTATTTTTVTSPPTAAPTTVTSPPTAAPTTVTSPPTPAPTVATPPATSPPVLTTAHIDLSGTPGVTPAEQHRAETLIEKTMADLRFFQTPAQAFAAGYRTIGDALTGDEHYVNWSYVTDGHILDPARPESVVYERRGTTQEAVAAMYMLPFGSTFASVPDVGGPLTQWHVHRNLCLTNDPQQKLVAGLTSLDGGCPTGTSKAGDTPMLHVWVVPNPCGPFAALEGVGAGQVPKGQTRNCDTSHASTP